MENWLQLNNVVLVKAKGTVVVSVLNYNDCVITSEFCDNVLKRRLVFATLRMKSSRPEEIIKEFGKVTFMLCNIPLQQAISYINREVFNEDV